MLGQGTFGQVAQCICQQTGSIVAVKVIKNQTAFYHQARVEVGVLQYLNRLGDPDDQHHIVRMYDFFVFKDHLCLVFELLSLNLYELIKQNQFQGLSMRLLRIFLTQVCYIFTQLNCSACCKYNSLHSVIAGIIWTQSCVMKPDCPVKLCKEQQAQRSAVIWQSASYACPCRLLLLLLLLQDIAVQHGSCCCPRYLHDKPFCCRVPHLSVNSKSLLCK